MGAESRWTVSAECPTESPMTSPRDITADNPDGEFAREGRAGIDEIHVLSVPDDMTEQAVDDTPDDREGLLPRITRLDVNRVEIRLQSGVVTVRYIP